MSDKKREIATNYLHLITSEMFATPSERGYTECPCQKECTLHGECHLCIAYHGRKNKLPRCER
jgi:hypothetical protein